MNFLYILQGFFCPNSWSPCEVGRWGGMSRSVLQGRDGAQLHASLPLHLHSKALCLLKVNVTH